MAPDPGGNNEIFLTLAEELHFERAAERLHVSQARVSQAIKKQERGVGAPLFDRKSRSVRLTTVGEQLRADLLPATRNPRWCLKIRHNPFVNAFHPIRNGDIDVLVAWLPLEEPDLTVGPVIYTEHSVLLVSRDHELATKNRYPSKQWQTTASYVMSGRAL